MGFNSAFKGLILSFQLLLSLTSRHLQRCFFTNIFCLPFLTYMSRSLQMFGVILEYNLFHFQSTNIHLVKLSSSPPLVSNPKHFLADLSSYSNDDRIYWIATPDCSSLEHAPLLSFWNVKYFVAMKDSGDILCFPLPYTWTHCSQCKLRKLMCPNVYN